MGWQALGLLALCAANIGLGILVIVHDPKAQTNRFFLLVVLAVVGWVSSISLALLTKDLQQTVSLGRLGFAFATLMPFALVCLFRTFEQSTFPLEKLASIIAGTFCVLFFALSLSPWIVADATPGTGRPNFIYGSLHPFLGAYLIGCLVFALYTLWRVATAASGIRRLQLSYLWIGVLLGGLGILSTNLFIPLLWKTSYYSVFGPYFTLVFVSFSAHAIIRHRLMDVRFVVRESVVYVAALAVASLVFLGVAYVTHFISGSTTEHLSLTTAVAIALMVAILFQPLKQWVNDSFNRYLYREPYNYQRTIRETSRRLSTVLDLQSLLLILTQVIDRTLRVESIAIYLPLLDAGGFALSAIKGQVRRDSHQPTTLGETSPLVNFLAQQQRPLLIEEPPRGYPIEALNATIDELRKAGGDAAFPLFEDSALTGVLVLGPKLSGDPLLADDIDLISTLLGQAAIAMKNAQLYRQVVLANERVENILETMDNGVIAVTDATTVTLFNSAAEKITGIDARLIKGNQVTALPGAIADPIQATLADLQPRLQVETSFKNPVKGVIPIIYSTSTMRDASGSVFGVVAVLSDVSRLRELEAEKRRTERLASIGAFASGIAHEIKNPLVAIKTFAELLPERFTEEEFRHEFARIAIQEIERIDELIGRLRGLVTPAPQQLALVSLRELIDETLALLRGQLEQAKIVVTTVYEDDSVCVSGDRSQLKQLILNVLINAIEAMQQGGDLGVELRRIHFNAEPCVLLEIQDAGTGIPEGLLSKIFDPFVTTKPQGSGLGLSICRGIVEAHRGSINAHSNSGVRGTTITIQLPLARPSLNASVQAT